MGNIQDFSTKFGQGQRATLFRVEGEIPGAGTNAEDRTFFIKAAQFPASTLGFIEVPFKGRKIKRPGDRTFAEWSITVLQDDQNSVREDFIGWMNQINNHFEISGDSVSDALFPDWTVTALRQDDSEAGSIEIRSCFPTEVGTIDFNYETVDTFAEFTVTIQYDYWVSQGTS
jgi:hypothetical protein|tara:strand:- start:462 stop:977 length:516 start_codon:yes stop_codon:yes gene_type:complete